MIQYLAIMTLGTAAGVLTGLIPGLHPNTVVFTTLPMYLKTGIGFLPYMSFIAGLSVSHTFYDFIPAIFLGAPEAASALSTLPGQEMALEGRGLEAFIYTVAGGAISILVLLALLPLFVAFLPRFYLLLKQVMFFVLVFVLSFMVFRSHNFLPAAVIVTLSGLLGLLAFKTPVNQNFVLMPVFAGLFALPSLVHARRIDFTLPPQHHAENFSASESFRGGSLGFVAGLVAGVLPGVGAAAATSLLSPAIGSRKQFLAGMGGVNTSDILVSFAALYLVGATRSGASVALQSLAEVTFPRIVFLAGLSLVSAALSIAAAPYMAKLSLELVERVDISRTSYAAIILISASTYFMTGLTGVLVMLTASSIGYAALLSRQRALAIAVLVVPAIIFYSKGIFM